MIATASDGLDYVGLGWGGIPLSGDRVISDDGSVGVVKIDKLGNLTIVDPDVGLSRWALRWMLWRCARDLLRPYSRIVSEHRDWPDKYASPAKWDVDYRTGLDVVPGSAYRPLRLVPGKPGLVPVLGRDFDPIGRQDREPVFRVLKCHNGSGEAPEIWRGTGDLGQRRALFHKVQKCGEFWVCPVCSHRITMGRREELRQAFGTTVTAHGGVAYLVTFTVPHSPADLLEDLLRQMLYARERLSNGSAFQNVLKRKPGKRTPARLGHKYWGRIRSLEIKWSPSGGWHPHLHEAWIFSEPLTTAELSVFDALPDAWADCCEDWWLRRPGKNGTDVRPIYDNAEYLAKFDSDRTWGAQYELAAGNAKSGLGPWALLEGAMYGDSIARGKFLEYAHAMRSVSPSSIHMGGKIRWAMKVSGQLVRSDDDLATRIESDAELITTLTKSQYRWITETGSFSTVLQLAEAGADVLQDFLSQYVPE